MRTTTTIWVGAVLCSGHALLVDAAWAQNPPTNPRTAPTATSSDEATTPPETGGASGSAATDEAHPREEKTAEPATSGPPAGEERSGVAETAELAESTSGQAAAEEVSPGADDRRQPTLLSAIPPSVEPQPATEEEVRFPEGERADMAEHPVTLDGISFRPGSGLRVMSEDGDFSLTTGLRAQFLYTVEKIEGEEATGGLQIRRARLTFSGNFFGENNEFKTEFAFSDRDMGVRDSAANPVPQTVPILDWYMDFTHLRDASLRVGQYKVPFNRQRVISSGRLQLVDRSIVNSELNLDRDIGLDVRSEDLGGWDRLRYYLGVYTGEGRNSNNQADFGMFYLGRVEVLPMGDFDDYIESDLERHTTPKLSLGAAYAFVDDSLYSRGTLGALPADGGTTDFHLGTVDAHFKWAGFSFLTEAILRDGTRTAGDATVVDEMTGEEEPVPVAAPRDGYGVMAQAGYLLPRSRFELAARAGVVRRFGEESGLTEESELGGGVSYYFAHHPFKLQADYFLLQEGNDDPLQAHVGRIQLQTSL